MHWRIKGSVFKILDVMPGGDEVHYWLQRWVTRTLPQSENAIGSIWQCARETVSCYEKHCGTRPPEATLLEIGAGRDLAYALSLRLLGFAHVLTIDLNPLARIELVQQVLTRLGMVAAMEVPTLTSLGELPRLLGLEYRAPMDARRTSLAAGSVHCLVSRDTLEHIPRDDIAAILREAHRILAPRGLVIMQIDYSDHYSHVDRRIGPFNFLTYTERAWRTWNSGFLYQNRLRHGDYVELFRRSGFEVLDEVVDREQPDANVESRLAPQWRDRDPRDVFALRARIMARKP
jgi:hypothetical protein